MIETLTSTRRRAGTFAAILCLFAGLAAVASAHVERPSYWPDPKPDCSIKPCTGGKAPAERSLASALDAHAPGTTRVVCQPDSVARLRRSIAHARRHGYFIRPTDHRSFSARQARTLLRINQGLRAMCRFDSIQSAVNASHNNDRVVIMPGLYTEPRSRAVPDHSKRCQKYLTHSDSGDPGALSHAYQVHCPNDANLVAVIGRGIGRGTVPDPPRADRHGIPVAGPCIRCNFQMEGSGVSADDVIVEAGDAGKGNRGPSAAGARKHVGIFVDRADSFVLRNLTVRHAREHDIYILESDGYRFDRIKTFYAGEYGVLTFVEDHGVMENCEAAGNGDAGLYPGSGAKTSAGRDKRWYPRFRYSQEIRDCDSHHNAGGYSGTNGSGTWVHDNRFYDNALGFTTDVFTAPGHPGYPQQGDLIENNEFYDNNFNPYLKDKSDVRPYIPAPVGTALWIAGGNDNVVRHNRVWDNYRRGFMLFAVPDVTVCGPDQKTPIPGCDPTRVSTSYRNRFTGNVMGIAPNGTVRPNGTDFWWDAFAGNTGNCWWANNAGPGRVITSSPSNLPDCDNGRDPSSSMGTGNGTNELELLGCLGAIETSDDYPYGETTSCSWEVTPSKPSPSTGSAARAASGDSEIARQHQQELMRLCSRLPGRRTCAPFTGVPGGTAPDAPAGPRVSFTGAWAQRPLGVYTCRDWNQASNRLRTRLVARLRHFVGGRVEGDRLTGFGSVLGDDTARTTLNARCAPSYAGAFALYKLYAAAAGFAGAYGGR